VVDRVYDAFLAALEEQGEIDLAEGLRPILEGETIARSAVVTDLILRLCRARL
jgi:hypothetical protein